MNAVEKLIADAEADLAEQTQELERWKAMMRDTSALDAVVNRCKHYLQEKRGVKITVLESVASNCYQKQFLSQHFAQFPSCATRRGDLLAVLGDDKQFSKEDKELLATYGIKLWTTDTIPPTGGPN
jgi:hypothetical protein